jgi:hypothetical protein
MLVHAGSPKALDVHGSSGERLDFDSVDRVGFAAMAAAGFVGFIAVVVCVG